MFNLLAPGFLLVHAGAFWRCLAICIVLAGVTGPACAQEHLLGRAMEDLQAGNAKAAYDRLAPAESARAGDPEYDYLLGLSALAAGLPTQAVFALERVLAVQPQHVNARTAMGRAHLALHETQAARREFEAVQVRDHSPNTRQTIQRYLSAVDQIEASGKFAARIFLEFAMGYDSNVNSASSSAQVAVPGLGGASFTIAPTSRDRSDGFLSVGAGLNFSNRLSPSVALTGGISWTGRFHFSETDYEPSFFDASLGITHTRALNTLSAGLQVSQVYISDPTYGDAYRESLGATLQWTRALEGNAQASVYVQYAFLVYPDQDPRDAQRFILGSAYGVGFDSGLSGFAGAYLGVEEEKESTYAYLGHRPLGLRLGADYMLDSRWGFFANAQFEQRTYRGTDPLFLVTRKDRQYGSAIGLNYALEKNWRLSPQVSYTKTLSNITIDQYDRWQVQVVMRGEF